MPILAGWLKSDHHLRRDSFASAEDESVPQIKLMTVEKYAQEEKKRLGKLKLSTPADPRRWYFHVRLDVARNNAQLAMRTF